MELQYIQQISCTTHTQCTVTADRYTTRLVDGFVWSATKTLSNFSSSPTKQPPDDPDTSTIIPGRGGHSTRAGRAWGAELQWTPANPATTREIQPTASNDRYQPSSLGRYAYSVAALCSRFSDQTSSFLTSSQTGTACTCIADMKRSGTQVYNTQPRNRKGEGLCCGYRAGPDSSLPGSHCLDIKFILHVQHVEWAHWMDVF